MASLYEHVARGALWARGYKSRYVPTPVGQVHAFEGRGRGTLADVALIHGFCAAGLHYAPLLRHVAPHVAKVIIPDMPAHGFSDAPRGPVTSETMKQGLFSALDACLDRPTVLFGNSLGGYASIHYALQRPERVRALVLCSPAGAHIDDATFDALVTLFKMKKHEDALRFLDLLFHARPPLRHLLAWMVRRKVSQREIRDLITAIEQNRALMLKPEQLAELKMPLLLLWGRSERILSGDQLEFFRRHLPPHVTIEEPEGFGHTPFLERPHAVSRILLRFLEQIASPSFAS